MISLSLVQNFFSKVETPKYIENKIQDLAIKHLNLKDVGELRDRYDGQLYLNNLRDDIRSEFAFENFLSYQFDWEKREALDYKRLKYLIENKKIQLSVFNLNKNPSIDEIMPTILVFLRPEKYAYIGPILFENELGYFKKSNEDALAKKIIIDLKKINLVESLYFKNNEELIKLLK